MTVAFEIIILLLNVDWSTRSRIPEADTANGQDEAAAAAAAATAAAAAAAFLAAAGGGGARGQYTCTCDSTR